MPTDYLGHQRVTWAGSPVHELNYVAPQIYGGYLESGSGIPTVFTIEGAAFKVAPANATEVALFYFQRTEAVSSSLNWLFTSHPDAYLAGSLAQAAAFTKDFDVAGTWLARCNKIFDDILSLDFNERQGMAVRVSGVTP